MRTFFPAIAAAIVSLSFSMTAIAGGHANNAADQQKAEEAAMVQMQISMTQAKRQAVIAENLIIDPAKAESFWALYREYSNERAKLAEEEFKLLVRFRDQLGSFTEEQAKAILDDHLRMEQKYTTLKKRYLSRFRRILTQKETLTYFQLENKMDAILDYEMAEVIPLAQ